MDYFEQMAELYCRQADMLKRAYRAVDPEQFRRAIKLLLDAPRIAASGCGQSGIACMHFVHLLCCIERPARFLHPGEALHGGLGFLLRGDVAVLCSVAGRTTEILAVEEACRSKHVHVVAVTEDLSSPLAKRADVLLRLAPCERMERLSAQDTMSFTLETVLFDSIQNAILARTGCTALQYAIDHPQGIAGASPCYEVPAACGPSD